MSASADVLPTLYQQYIHQTRYARWRDDIGRREAWPESVERYVTWFSEQCELNGYKPTEDEVDDVRQYIKGLMVLPSMRAFMTAGDALRRDNVAGYNCAYVAVDHPRAFDESLYILMCGTGIGFSVERQFINRLPEVPEEMFEADDTIVVADSRKGWAAGYRKLLAMLWTGHIPKWDLSKLRPAGARLKTFGGRSSGPGPLDDLFRYTVQIFKNAAGRKLNSIECHGIMCKIGDCVVSGGVRRSALISLSNPSDERMRDAKSGKWYDDPEREHFQLANNSAVWTEKPDPGRFLDEWTSLYKSKSGERGIINRVALQKQAAKHGKRDPNIEYGVNPCSEIILRSAQFCNLTSIVVRPGDELDDLKRKATVAAILGTVQATLTDFKYLRPIWKKNCEEERLLGVSLNGLMDHPILSEPTDESARWYEELREHVVEVNAEWAAKLDINPAAAATCEKPEGTGSQLVNCPPGMHRWKYKQYLRNTRDSKGDPAAEVVRMSGVPCDEDVHKPSNWVMSWPIKAPDGAKTQEDETAIEQLKMWYHLNKYWCDHKPSVSIDVREDEWIKVAAFVYDHFDDASGIAFFPRQDNIYKQAPYEQVDDDRWQEVCDEMPDEIDWTLLGVLETTDQTSNSKELACTAPGSCEI